MSAPISEQLQAAFDHPFGTRVDRAALSARLDAAHGWEAKSRLLVQLARDLPPLPDSEKTDANRVSGCESTVWLISHQQDGRLYLAADSDSRVIKGLLTLLLTAYHAQTPEIIRGFELEAWLNQLGLARFLTASRGNGLRAISRKIVDLASQLDQQVGG